MATTNPPQQAAAPVEPPRPIRRAIAIALVALAAAVVAAGATWFATSRHLLPTANVLEEVRKAPRPVYFALDPMTVNLQSDDGEAHYLRIGLTLKLDDEATGDYLTQHMPEIRSRVLLALSAKRPSELAPLEGKRALAAELATLIAQPDDPHAPPARIDDVLFTEFVVQ